MIKTFWFDLGNVILPFNFAPAYAKLSALSGLSIRSFENFFEQHPELESQLDEGLVSGNDLYQSIKKELCMKGVSFLDFKNIWNDIFKENKSVMKLIHSLKANGSELILISNTNLLHFQHIQKTYSVISVFDHLVLSYELKIRKPDKEIYHHALKLSKATPEEILYIDDRSDLTIAAKKHGVHTHTFVSYRGLREQLRKLKVVM